MSWKPELAEGVDVRTLPLSPLHGFVLSRVDGSSDVGAIALGTGLPRERIEQLLRELVLSGALRPNPDAPAPARPEPDADAAEPSAEAPAAEPAEAPDDEADAATEEPEPATHRQRYETTLRAQTAEARVGLAKQAVEPNLSALCFDPLPAVVIALLENPNVGLTQARLVAKHHRNPVGLEAYAARGDFAADLGVRRNLLHNPQLPQSLYRRLWGGRRMLEQHKVTISREVPEQTRRTAREVLRTRFSSGPSEEKAELILKTEGRCLAALVGLPIDSKTTALLCARTYGSTLFIQNLARWSAAPPPLIAHLLRQDLVKRNAMLRNLLERHPNAPKGHV
jgi:hypothetical protein